MTSVKTKLTKNEDGFYNYNDIVDYRTAKQFLNQEFGKDWHMKIDLDKLDMDSPDYCVLGQLHGCYLQALDKFFNGAMGNDKAFGACSFINWKKKIAKRQAKTAKKQLTTS